MKESSLVLISEAMKLQPTRQDSILLAAVCFSHCTFFSLGLYSSDLFFPSA
uniref:Uncharacterized protein n=1 Tax=Arundo donax TaxID=35708 RepID=A0A0A9A318_ARUDO